MVLLLLGTIGYWLMLVAMVRKDMLTNCSKVSKKIMTSIIHVKMLITLEINKCVYCVQFAGQCSHETDFD